MASQASDDEVSKRRTKKWRCSEEAVPTSAKREKNEREYKLKKAKRRQALHRETPTRFGDDPFFAEPAPTTCRLPAYPAFDEYPRKRRKIDHCFQQAGISSARKPFPASGSPGPIAVDDRFTKLPAEIHDEILRYLLLWPQDIAVFYGWSRVFPRSRPHLNLSVLSACRVLKERGLRILFGENTFAYNARDPITSHGHTIPVLEKVFGECQVPIDKYGHLIRHVKIKIDRNRLLSSNHRQNFKKAVQKFLPGGGLDCISSLHTLTLDVPFERNWLSTRDKPWDEMPICRALKKGSSVNKALLELRIPWVVVLARDSLGNCWETKIDMRYFVKDQQMKTEHMALNKKGKHGEIGRVGEQRIETRYRTKDIEIVEGRWEHGVQEAVAGLENLAGRIYVLATGRNSKAALKFWQPVVIPERGDGNDFLALPSNWREHTYDTRSGLSRRSTLIASKPDISIESNLGEKSNTEAKDNGEAEIIDSANVNNLGIFNARDTAKEKILLEAQQGAQDIKAESGVRGMLTRKWLENLPKYDLRDT